MPPLRARVEFMMKYQIAAFVILAAAVVVSPVQSAEQSNAGPLKWKQAIEKFKKQDAANPPKQGAVLFVGSSSIRLWDLKKWFPDLPTVNRGFGGSHVEDSVYYVDTLVLKHRPQTVVLYAGDNDLAAGKTPATVLADYQRFVAAIHEALPGTRIVYIAVKPSLKRWNLIAQVRETNALIRELSAGDDRLRFVDIDQAMLGDDGMPRPELFVEDGLHLSEQGYALWTERVRASLER